MLPLLKQTSKANHVTADPKSRSIATRILQSCLTVIQLTTDESTSSLRSLRGFASCWRPKIRLSIGQARRSNNASSGSALSSKDGCFSTPLIQAKPSPLTQLIQKGGTGE